MLICGGCVFKSHISFVLFSKNLIEKRKITNEIAMIRQSIKIIENAPKINSILNPYRAYQVKINIEKIAKNITILVFSDFCAKNGC